MAFSFECPHCEMGFEAEFELCGSTCTCPGCGGLFLVPEVDPASLVPAQPGDKGSATDADSGAPGAEVFLELARLQEELAAAVRQRQELEQQLALEKGKASKQTALSVELKAAKAAQKKADVLAEDLDKQLKSLQQRWDQSEKTVREQRRELELAAEQLRKDLTAASEQGEGSQLAVERARQEAERSAQELATLRQDLEAANSENRRLGGEVVSEREKAAQQLAGVRGELVKAELELRGAEEKNAGRSGELDRLQAVLEAERKQSATKLEKQALALEEKEKARLDLEEEANRARTALQEAVGRHARELAGLREGVAEGQAKLQLLEKEREKARTAAQRELEALQKRFDEQKREAERSALATVEATKEAERLRAELAGVKAEKWSAERGFAEEHQRLMDRLQGAETERENFRDEVRLLTRAAAEPDAELERVRRELLEARSAGGAAEKVLAAERAEEGEKRRVLEQARQAAEERAKGLLGELADLRGQLEQAQKNPVSQKSQEIGGKGLSAEAEAELRQVLARRDLEIQRLAAQLRSASQGAAGDSASHSVWAGLQGKTALAFGVVALVVGLLGGAVISRPKAGTLPAPGLATKDTLLPATVAPSASSVAAEPLAAPNLTPGADQGNPSTPTTAPSPGSENSLPPATGGTLTASRSGMPSSLPDQFLGIRFGTDLSEVPGISLWKETAGKRHRKAELLGSEVEAVLTADSQSRLIMGSYVRVAFRQPEALTPFLEWAVNVQDAVSALYGEPIRVHSVEGATDAAEVVRKIAAGEDYYQATWEREAEDGMIDLSIRVFNERSVVFRMEYRARRLYQTHVEDQAAKDSTPKEASKDGSKDAVKTAEKDVGKDTAKESAPPASASGKVE